MKTIRRPKEQIPSLARQKGFIEGIYNYCDLWCEKCPFTSKCLIHSCREDKTKTSDTGLWKFLDNAVESTMLMINEIMDKLNIRPETIKDTEHSVSYTHLTLPTKRIV